MNFLNDNFKLISLALNSLILLIVLSIKVSTCTLANDMRTTKKVTKALNEKTITSEELNEKLENQTEKYLVKEKQLDGVKDTIKINEILRDTTKRKRK